MVSFTEACLFSACEGRQRLPCMICANIKRIKNEKNVVEQNDVVSLKICLLNINSFQVLISKMENLLGY